MADNFGDRLQVVAVSELSERGVIFVEDGNHGENRPRQDEFATTGIAFIRPPDLKDGRVDFENCDRINAAGFQRVRKGIGQRGDIILTHRATVGRIAMTGKDAPEVFVTNPGTTIWRSTDPAILNQRYLYCFMRSAPFMDQLWSQVGNNSTFDYVSLTQQRGLRVAFPPIGEQLAIAHILGALDDKIELNRRMNETLEAVVRALFTSWFVDFDPVRAKADGRDPGIPQSLANLFPHSFEDSELGEIPRGWEVRGLDEIARFLNGLALQKYPAGDGESLPVIKIAQLRAGHTAGADRASGALPSDYVVDDGDVLFSWSGSLEVLIWAAGRGALNQHLFKVTSSQFPKWYYYLWICHHLPNFRRIAEAKATTMGHIQRHHLTEARVVVPPQELLVAADRYLAPLIDELRILRVQSRSLGFVRDELLPKLVSGDVRLVRPSAFLRERA